MTNLLMKDGQNETTIRVSEKKQKKYKGCCNHPAFDTDKLKYRCKNKNELTVKTNILVCRLL